MGCRTAMACEPSLSLTTVTGEGNRTFRVARNGCTPPSTLGGGRGHVCMLCSHTRSVVLSPVTGLRQTFPCYWATVTIQPTPKRSVPMPKHGDQHVLPMDICDAVSSCSWMSLEGGACAGTQGTSGKRRGLCTSRGLLLPGHHAYRWALGRGVSLGRAARHTPPTHSAPSEGQTGQ